MIRIELPWPSNKLSPNARTHYAVKMKITAAHKETAYMTAKPISFERIILPVRTHVRIIFHAPDRRKRDLDNLLSSCKAYLDGIAIALGINDSLFRPITIDFAETTYPQGRVEICLDQQVDSSSSSKT